MRAWVRARDRAEATGVGVLAGFFFLVTVAPLLVSVALSPDDIDSGRVRLTGPCPYLAETGTPCGSCGLTRAFASMSRGQLARASAYNPAGPVVWGLFVVGAGTSGYAVALVLARLAELKRQGALAH